MGDILHDVRVVGVVLAAGRSERMGAQKALLEIAGRSFLEAVLDTMSEVGVQRRIVVAGPNATALERHIPRGVLLVGPGTGPQPIDSIRVALQSCEGADAILVWPVDHPHVAAETVRALVDAYAEFTPPIVAPSFRGRRGHPMIWNRVTWEALRGDPAGDAGGARAVARRFSVHHVVVDDLAVIEDIDTPEAYRTATRRLEERGS